MSPFLEGFSSELVKHAGVGSRVVKSLAKRPMKTLLGAGIVGGTGIAAARGYKSGLSGGDRGRYLAATVDRSGRARPSRAAYTNYHNLFGHELGRAGKRRLHQHYRESDFKR